MTNLESGAVITPQNSSSDSQDQNQPDNQPTNQNQGQEPILKDDPFKPDQPSPDMPKKPAKSGGGKSKGKVVMLIVLVLLLAAAVGYGVYYWQHKQVNDQATTIQAQQKQIDALQAQVKDLEANNKKLVVVNNTFKFPEISIQLTLPTSIQDLVYVTSTAMIWPCRTRSF